MIRVGGGGGRPGFARLEGQRRCDCVGIDAAIAGDGHGADEGRADRFGCHQRWRAAAEKYARDCARSGLCASRA